MLGSPFIAVLIDKAGEIWYNFLKQISRIRKRFMQLSDAIRDRRSVRKYVEYDMPDEDIRTILEAGMLAPSAKNTRPWEFVVLKSREAKERAMKVHPFAKHLEKASIGILVCASTKKPEVAEMGFFPQDCGASIENILLQSLDLGYGSCWCGIYPNETRVEDFMREFGLDSLPIALVVVGRAETMPDIKGFYDDKKVKII